MGLLNLASIVVASLLLAGAALRGGFTTTDPPVPIPDNTGSLAACQTIQVTEQCFVAGTSVRVTSDHAWIGDISFAVTSPAGTVLTLLNRPGRFQSGAGENDNLIGSVPIRFSDFASSGTPAEEMGLGCADGNIGMTPGCEADEYLPAPDAGDTPIPGLGAGFFDFNDQEGLGTWILCAADSGPGNTGTLISWTLELECFVPVELESLTGTPE